MALTGFAVSGRTHILQRPTAHAIKKSRTHCIRWQPPGENMDAGALVLISQLYAKQQFMSCLVETLKAAMRPWRGIEGNRPSNPLWAPSSLALLRHILQGVSENISTPWGAPSSQGTNEERQGRATKPLPEPTGSSRTRARSNPGWGQAQPRPQQDPDEPGHHGQVPQHQERWMLPQNPAPGPAVLTAERHHLQLLLT